MALAQSRGGACFCTRGAIQDYDVVIVMALQLTFGGMWRWRRVAVARVFALVVRYRVMMFIT